MDRKEALILGWLIGVLIVGPALCDLHQLLR